MKYLRIFLILLLIPFMVLAEECDISNITITSMKPNKIEGNTEVISDPTFEDRTINLDLKMFEVGDSITYDMTIKNESEEDYTIDEDTFKTDSEYLEYSLKVNDNTNIVKAKSIKKVTLTVAYKKEVDDYLLTGNKYDASNNLTLSLNTNEKERPMEVITTDNIKKSVAPQKVKNPLTSATSIKMVIIVSLAVLVIIYLTIHNKKKYNKYIILVLSIYLIPIVYAICQVEVVVRSNVEIEKVDSLKRELIKMSKENNSCISKYEGDVTEKVNKTVAATSVYFDNCSNRNVIFGGFCWEVIRTTETGGVKMIYNGEPVDGKCRTKENHMGIVGLQSTSSSDIGTEYLYGNSFSYDLDTATFTLHDTFTATFSDSTYEELLGKYTCLSNNNTCTVLYYLNDYINSNKAYLSPYKIDQTAFTQIGSSSFNANILSPASVGYMLNKSYYSIATQNLSIPYNNENLSSSNIYIYGDSYTDNQDGTYTINNPTELRNWSSSYTISERMNNKYICKNPINNACSELWYAYIVASNKVYFYKTNPGYYFANSFKYSNGVYTLDGEMEKYWNLTADDYISYLNNHHYTCWNGTTQCTTISYIYNHRYFGPKYVNITSGKGINEALGEMFWNDDVNRYDSSIKGIVDTWYKQNLLSQTNKLEDIVYCNNRSIISLGGWNPNHGEAGETVDSNITFKNYEKPKDLSCLNVTDQFSVSNEKAKLKYPVALIASEEAYNIESKSLIEKESAFWTLSPSYFFGNTNNVFISKYSIWKNAVGQSQGVRPVISISAKNVLSSGTGTVDDPWIIE